MLNYLEKNLKKRINHSINSKNTLKEFYMLKKINKLKKELCFTTYIVIKILFYLF